ncbi:hypothetical protein F2Q70_00014876 [Brassica cretica]|uniref:Uncharacterized protein n=1 Tax=Brassica cretica TaxID=69181 RepID=A0A8S9HVN6_BRACR|nr:hypothetical protein F2Q70_00014876 [Brassica cretica]
MHGLMSYRRFGRARARSLRSDRASARALELGRYVGTELLLELSSSVTTSVLNPKFSLGTRRDNKP